MTSELSDEDKWPLPDYHPGPTQKQLHALGVLSINFVTLQGSMDDLYFLKAAAGAEKYYYALSEDKRSQTIKDLYKHEDPKVVDVIGNLVSFFDWSRNCRNNLLHAESYPSAVGRPSDDAFELTKRIDRLSTRHGYMKLTLRQVRAVADHMREGVVQCAKISLFLRYSGRSSALPDKYRKHAHSLPAKLMIPRRMKLAEKPQGL
jgi:hypothetical protein